MPARSRTGFLIRFGRRRGYCCAMAAAVIQGLFALSVAATGWYYMFYSRAASRLGEIENESLNRRRMA